MRASRLAFALGSVLATVSSAFAAEMTFKNDSVTDFSTAVIVTGFTATEKAASWLTTTCTGNIRAVHVFWRSASGGTAPQFGEKIEIFRSGTFPNPGMVAQTILGPLLNDGVINEFRFLDENQTIPLVVPVTANETFVVSLDFDVAPPQPEGPSVVRDTDGCQAGRNAIFAELAPGTNVWFSACALGVTGDWVIRAVVDCNAGALSADLSATLQAMPSPYVPGQPLQFTLNLANAGPSTVIGASVTDNFPAALTNVSWTCAPGTGTASCGAASGNGNINTTVNLGALSTATIVASGTVAAGTQGNLANSATIAPPSGVTETNPMNNIASIQVPSDIVFASGFED